MPASDWKTPVFDREGRRHVQPAGSSWLRHWSALDSRFERLCLNKKCPCVIGREVPLSKSRGAAGRSPHPLLYYSTTIRLYHMHYSILHALQYTTVISYCMYRWSPPGSKSTIPLAFWAPTVQSTTSGRLADLVSRSFLVAPRAEAVSHSKAPYTPWYSCCVSASGVRAGSGRLG